MITKERLSSSRIGSEFLDLITVRLRKYHVLDWGNNDSQTKSENRPGDRAFVTTLQDANVVTSRHTDNNHDDLLDGSSDSLGARHALVIDIDHPAWLMPSTTPGHFHLYVDVPGGITNDKYATLLTALADAGVIEWGYASASIARGFTSVRLPWIRKEKGPIQHD